MGGGEEGEGGVWIWTLSGGEGAGWEGGGLFLFPFWEGWVGRGEGFWEGREFESGCHTGGGGEGRREGGEEGKGKGEGGNFPGSLPYPFPGFSCGFGLVGMKVWVVRVVVCLGKGKGA